MSAQMRQHIHNLISSITPFDAIEAKDIQETLDWIHSGAEIWRIKSPDVPRKHLNTYFFIWDPVHQKALFGDHVKSGLWLPGGGHVEIGEHPRDTIIREMREEFDLEADFLTEEPCFMAAVETVGLTAGHIDVGLWFLVRGDSSVLPSFDSSEFRSIKWCNLNEIAQLPTDKNMGRFLKKMLKASPIEIPAA
jgi:ADP-ribose pyrophosphatase YjhB (NUDIX family)